MNNNQFIQDLGRVFGNFTSTEDNQLTSHTIYISEDYSKLIPLYSNTIKKCISQGSACFLLSEGKAFFEDNNPHYSNELIIANNGVIHINGVTDKNLLRFVQDTLSLLDYYSVEVDELRYSYKRTGIGSHVECSLVLSMNGKQVLKL
jgi:hypothetical protein